jgi:hypothetical protein
MTTARNFNMVANCYETQISRRGKTFKIFPYSLQRIFQAALRALVSAPAKLLHEYKRLMADEIHKIIKLPENRNANIFHTECY